MCGICGVVTDGSPPEVGLVTRMMGRLRHRGPDGSGYFRDGRVALGHTRLAIIDVAGGAQPMCNEDGNVWVTFNGEIFNYVELGEELRRRGHAFRTSSDTEVVVHAWEEWGEDCFSRFNGQWALALWDRREERLVLSRDRLGVRPLFYARNGSRLVFASEVKALFADPSLPRELDPAGLDETFTFWSTVAPRTVFRGSRAGPARPRRRAGPRRLPHLAVLVDLLPGAGARGRPGRDGERRGAARADRRGRAAAVPAQRRPGGRLPVRRASTPR